ncbi:SipW-dependent-type signal peptide-containing protein [Neobacillus vireti]|uniref:SipW-dependent-type signal peptide-containing protein n=1 Tax=Neobacillus vireti TaxID=220686 RepID=UPI0030001620
MKEKVTNFVLNKLRLKNYILFRTNEEGVIIRKSRLKKFRKKSKNLLIAAQLVAIWYLLIIAGSYLTTNTGAYFNDVETIEGSISVSEDFCKDVQNGSDFWHKYCKDNAGIGNGPDTPDQNTGEHTDPDNPGHNKGGCDDHTNAPCSEAKQINETHTSNSITLTWIKPSNVKFVRIYKNGSEKPVVDNLIEEIFIDENLLPSTKYSYKITTVDNSGKESLGLNIDVTTSGEDSPSVLPENVTDLKGIRNGNSQNIELSWKNPTGISHVRIYNQADSTLIEDNVKGENIKLTSNDKVTYRVTTVDSSGNESSGVTVTVPLKE